MIMTNMKHKVIIFRANGGLELFFPMTDIGIVNICFYTLINTVPN